jgi:hypothetical protein
MSAAIFQGPPAATRPPGSTGAVCYLKYSHTFFLRHLRVKGSFVISQYNLKVQKKTNFAHGYSKLIYDILFFASSQTIETPVDTPRPQIDVPEDLAYSLSRFTCRPNHANDDLLREPLGFRIPATEQSSRDRMNAILEGLTARLPQGPS